MPCYPVANDPVKQEAMDKAYAELEAQVASGRAQLVKNRDGTIGIRNWSETSAARAGWCEGCIIAKMGNTQSWAVKAKMQQMGLVRGKQFVAPTHRGHSHTVGARHKK